MADLSTVGVNGLTSELGLTTTNPVEAATRRAMLLAGRCRVVPAVSAKLGRNSFCSFAEVGETDLIITDAGSDADLVAELGGLGPEVVVVPAGSRSSAAAERPRAWQDGPVTDDARRGGRPANGRGGAAGSGRSGSGRSGSGRPGSGGSGGRSGSGRSGSSGASGTNSGSGRSSSSSGYGGSSFGRPAGARPDRGTDRGRDDRNRRDQGRDDRGQSERGQRERGQRERGQGERGRDDRDRSDRSGTGRGDERKGPPPTGGRRGAPDRTRPWDDRGRPPREDRGRPESGAGAGGRPPRTDRNGAPYVPPPGLRRRDDEPPVPTDVDTRLLDRRVRAELRGLPKELAEVVAAYLLRAGQLIEEDPELAYAHAEAARRRAARLPIVREATAETAYAAGKFDVALGEYRALRRMTGSPDYLPVMADCERALGRTDAAMRLVREGHDVELSADQWAELRMVEAGIRDDLGQRPEALRVLAEALGQLGRRASTKRPELREALARMHYAYGDLLVQDGDQVSAREAFATAADLDVDGATDAHERVDLLDGMDLMVGDDDHDDDDHDDDDHDDDDHDDDDQSDDHKGDVRDDGAQEER